jgi:hypothetical protein
MASSTTNKERDMTKACEDCGVQIPTLQLGAVCGPCLLGYIDTAVEEASGVTAITITL